MNFKQNVNWKSSSIKDIFNVTFERSLQLTVVLASFWTSWTKTTSQKIQLLSTHQIKAFFLVSMAGSISDSCMSSPSKCHFLLVFQRKSNQVHFVKTCAATLTLHPLFWIWPHCQSPAICRGKVFSPHFKVEAQKIGRIWRIIGTGCTAILCIMLMPTAVLETKDTS